MKRFHLLLFVSVLSLGIECFAGNLTMNYTWFDGGPGYKSADYTFMLDGETSAQYSNAYYGGAWHESTTIYREHGLSDTYTTYPIEPAATALGFGDAAAWATFLGASPTAPGGFLATYFPAPQGGYVDGQTYTATIPEPATGFFLSIPLFALLKRRSRIGLRSV